MTPTEELASLRANYRLCERRLADARRERDTAETDLIALRANLKLERECVVALGKSFDQLRAENRAQRELLKESADALESLFVTQNGLGMSSQTLTKLRAHLAQSEPGAGKEGA